MFKPQRSRAETLSFLQDPEPAPSLDRSAKYKEALKWLDEKARELKVSTADPAYDLMIQTLGERYDTLNDAWTDGTDSEFVQAIREHAAAGLKALKIGIERENDSSEQKGQITSERQVFQLAREVFA